MSIYGLGGDIIVELSDRAWYSLEQALAFRWWANDPPEVRIEIQNLINEIRALRQRLAKKPACDLI